MAKKALVVDDSLTMRNMVSVALKRMQWEAETAKDGEEALEIAAKGKFDLVIADINMPGIDGIEMIKRLRATEAYKFTPILVLTTEGGSDTKHKGKNAGASGWIVKPFNAETMASAVNKLCG